MSLFSRAHVSEEVLREVLSKPTLKRHSSELGSLRGRMARSHALTEKQHINGSRYGSIPPR